jgi:hypothetical protein
MKIEAIMKKAAATRLASRLPEMLQKLPPTEAFTVHDLLRRFKGITMNTLRCNLCDMPDRERYKARVGRDFYYGHPEAIRKLKEQNGQG